MQLQSKAAIFLLVVCCFTIAFVCTEIIDDTRDSINGSYYLRNLSPVAAKILNQARQATGITSNGFILTCGSFIVALLPSILLYLFTKAAPASVLEDYDSHGEGLCPPFLQ